MARLFTPFQQFFDGSGEPLSSGTLEFFEDGVYSNQLDTYSDASLNNVNPNPITLDGEGRLPFDIFGDGVYSIELRDKNSILINLLDTVGGDTGSRTAFSDWTSTIIYNIPAFVVGSDGLYYRSLSNDNLGNDPIEDSGTNEFWEEFKLRGVYNSSITYEIGDVVQTSVGNVWKALTQNISNDPETDDGTNWGSAFNEQVKGYSSSESYGVGDTVKTTTGNLWKSLTASNQGNNPETDSGTNWEPAFNEQVKEYSSSESYGVGDTVKTTTGNLWKSLTASNQGNDPETDDGTNWDVAIKQSINMDNVNVSDLDNPLLHAFAKNDLVRVMNGATVLTSERSTVATYVGVNGTVRTADIDDPREELTGWLFEGAGENLFLNPETPATQNIVITASTWTLSVNGTGDVTTIYGVATQESPLTFVSTGESLLCTVSGSLNTAQLEDSPFATSQINTGTRSADDISFPVQGNFRESEGCIFLKVDVNADVNNSYLLSISDNTVDNRTVIRWLSTKINLSVYKDGVQQVNISTPTLEVDTQYSIEVNYQDDNIELFIDGVSTAIDISGELPADLTTVDVASSLYGHIQDLRFYDRNLTLDEIKYLGDA